MAASMGQLPSFRSTLGNIGTGPAGGRRQKERLPAQPDAAQPQAQPQQARTFSQMQQSGEARPAPRQVMQPASRPSQTVGQSLEDSVKQALDRPSRYGSQEFTQVRDAARADLTHQFAKRKDSLETDLARRGLAASSFGANDLYSLEGEQSRAMADLDAQLLDRMATTQGADRASAIGAAQNYENANRSQALQEAGLTGLLNGQSTLGKQSLDQSGQQFSVQQQLAERLGLGNLGLQEKQLNQSGDQFSQSLDFQKQQADIDRQFQSGQMTLAQKDQALRELANQQQYGLAQTGQSENARQFNLQQQLQERLGLGNLDLQQKQLAQSGSQFDKSFGLQSDAQKAQQSQFSLQQALAEKLGLGNLDLQKLQLGQQDKQFDKSLGVQQGQLDLQKQLGLGNLDLQKQGLAQSGDQFNKSFGLQQAAQALDEKVRLGQMSMAEAQLELQKLSQKQNYDMGLSGQELQKQQLTQSGELGKQNLLLQYLNSVGAGAQPELAAQIAALLGLKMPAKNGTGSGETDGDRRRREDEERRRREEQRRQNGGGIDDDYTGF